MSTNLRHRNTLKAKLQEMTFSPPHREPALAFVTGHFPALLQQSGNGSLNKNVFAACALLVGSSLVTTAHSQSGIASVYSGGRTANGEHARAGGMTAAHRTLPFGTMVRVTSKHSGRSVMVRINDRGPFVRGRIIDVTPAAARALGFSGLASVSLSVAGRANTRLARLER